MPLSEPGRSWRRVKHYAGRHAKPTFSPAITVPGAQDTSREWTRELAALLSAIGTELLRAGQRTSDVEADLRDIAARYGMHARSFVVPTGLFVQVDHAAREGGGEIDFAPVVGGDLRLDQVQALHDLVARLRGEAVPFDQARAALAKERAMPERFSPAGSVLGYALLTVGLGAMLHATAAAMLGYAVLGAAVGLLRLLTARYWPAAGPILPVAAAVLATALSLRFAGPLLHEAPQNLFIPPLIAFLPGSALTMGAIELAVGDVLSGVARLAGAVNVLMLLALGILVATDGVSASPAGRPAPELLGDWAAWCGVLLLAGGFTLSYSAPSRTLLWLTVALLAERGVLAAGAALGGTALGAFAAGMLLPPIASWIQRHHSIPDQVVFLPCFWMLVPGATGLRGVSELLADQGTGSLATLVTTLVTVVAIALGIVVGAGLQHRTRLEVATGDETSESPTGGYGRR